MGYYNIGEDPQVIRNGKWLDSTNMALKHHVVRLGLGTSNNLRYTLSANDLPFGIIQTAGTYLERLTVATEGVVLCVNSIAGTINIGDPVIQDYGNTGGTVGHVRSAVMSLTLADVDGTASNDAGGTRGRDAFYYIPLPIALPIKPGSLKSTGTATYSCLVPEAAGTTLAIDQCADFVGGDFYCLANYPIMGIALDQANSPRDKLRVKLARQNDVKNHTTY